MDVLDCWDESIFQAIGKKRKIQTWTKTEASSQKKKKKNMPKSQFTTKSKEEKWDIIFFFISKIKILDSFYHN